MALINEILDQELQALNEGTAVSEADRNTAVAAVAEDHAAMSTAIEAHGAGLTDAQKAEIKTRLELIEFADNISHS